MVINENIRDIKDISIPQIQHSFKFEEIVINKLNLTDGMTYTISLDAKQIGEKTNGFTFNLYNVGPKRVIAQTGVFDKRNHMTFKYEEGKTHKINVYTGLLDVMTNSGAKFYNIKLEKGDKMTPYLPYVNSLDPSKQAIFVAGGTFKEVYPI